MALTARSRLLCVALGCLWFVSISGAQPLTWQGAKTNAMGLALSEGKLVLLMAGRPYCPDCSYMQNTVCETNSPPIKELIQNQYVPWYCAIDTSHEYYAYTNGLDTGFYLPLICCIDPADPDNWLDRTTGVQNTQVFYERLLAQVGNQLTNARISRCWVTNGSITLTLANLVWGKTNYIERTLDLQSWTPAGEVRSTTRGTNWSEMLDAGWTGAFYRISIPQ